MTLKDKLAQRLPINGTHISMPSPENGEIMGQAGFDFIWIDTEHAPIDLKTLLTCISLTKSTGTAALVRVPVNDYNATKKVIEMGPDGIVFPMVNTKETAEAVIKSTLYPPYGTRGFGPMGSVKYGALSADEYVKNGVFQMARLVQVESEEAVLNLDEILTVEHIDGFIIGPCDLAASVGELGCANQPKTDALIETTSKKLIAAGKSFGVSLGNASKETIHRFLSMGANIISSGVDYGYLLQGAKDMLSRIDSIRNEFNN